MKDITRFRSKRKERIEEVKSREIEGCFYFNENCKDKYCMFLNIWLPECFRSNPSEQQKAENDCKTCIAQSWCIKEKS